MPKIKFTWGEAIQQGRKTPILDAIRIAARAEKYVGTAGLQEFVKDKYNGKLMFNTFGEISGLIADESKVTHLKIIDDKIKQDLKEAKVAKDHKEYERLKAIFEK